MEPLTLFAAVSSLLKSPTVPMTKMSPTIVGAPAVWTDTYVGLHDILLTFMSEAVVVSDAERSLTNQDAVKDNVPMQFMIRNQDALSTATEAMVKLYKEHTDALIYSNRTNQFVIFGFTVAGVVVLWFFLFWPVITYVRSIENELFRLAKQLPSKSCRGVFKRFTALVKAQSDRLKKEDAEAKGESEDEDDDEEEGGKDDDNLSLDGVAVDIQPRMRAPPNKKRTRSILKSNREGEKWSGLSDENLLALSVENDAALALESEARIRMEGVESSVVKGAGGDAAVEGRELVGQVDGVNSRRDAPLSLTTANPISADTKTVSGGDFSSLLPVAVAPLEELVFSNYVSPVNPMKPRAKFSDTALGVTKAHNIIKSRVELEQDRKTKGLASTSPASTRHAEIELVAPGTNKPWAMTTKSSNNSPTATPVQNVRGVSSQVSNSKLLTPPTSPAASVDSNEKEEQVGVKSMRVHSPFLTQMTWYMLFLMAVLVLLHGIVVYSTYTYPPVIIAEVGYTGTIQIDINTYIMELAIGDNQYHTQSELVEMLEFKVRSLEGVYFTFLSFFFSEVNLFPCLFMFDGIACLLTCFISNIAIV
jgi:hypothetical protein